MKHFRFLKRAVVLAMAAVLLVSSTVVLAKEPVSVPDKEGKLAVQADGDFLCNDYEWGVLYLTNKIRMSEGLEPLSTYTELQNAANVRKNELVTSFSHTRPNNTSCFTAITEAGTYYTAVGENIAQGYGSPASVMTGWMNSQGHRDNILGVNYTHMAPGYLSNGNQWVQLFTGSCTATSISVVDADQYYYCITSDMSIDDAGLVVAVSCKHGTSYLPLTEEMCSGFDPDVLREIQTVTVTCKGCSAEVDLYVYPPMNFEDVSEDAWYYDDVKNIYMLGLMTGTTDTTFLPESALLRAQFATILYRMEDSPVVTTDPVFVDVPKDEWYTDAVVWANQAGIVTGYTNGSGKFGPSDNITREQMAVMMYRYANLCGYDISLRASLSGYRDAASVNDYALEAMEWAVATGLISGKYNQTLLDPLGNTTRAECATILNRFITKYGF